jgi:hypothetical protein
LSSSAAIGKREHRDVRFATCGNPILLRTDRATPSLGLKSDISSAKPLDILSIFDPAAAAWLLLARGAAKG